MTLDATIYHVYKAKKYAERNVTVGKETTHIAVYSASDEVRIVLDNGKDYLDKQFKRYGPQEIREQPVMRTSYFVTPTEWKRFRQSEEEDKTKTAPKPRRKK
jgi:hypothetical protein